MGMLGKRKKRTAFYGGVAALCIAANRGLGATNDTPITREEFLQLEKQNQLLQQQIQVQQKMIDALNHKVADIQDHEAQHPADSSQPTAPVKAEDLAPPSSDTSLRIGKVDITGEGGLAFVDSQSQGQMPHPTFQIDEARLFLEAPVW